MIIALPVSWIEDFLQDFDPYIIYQNVKWNFIRCTGELAYEEFGCQAYNCEFDLRKDFEQLSLFD